MMTGRIKQTGIFLFSRVIVVYALLFGVSLLFVDYAAIRERIIIRTLNHNMPASFAYLLELSEETLAGDPDEERLREYTNYYEKVTRYMPQLAEAHAMLGFSYFHLGKLKEATGEYKKAAVLNPQFFWHQYNLGVLHFLTGDLEQAAKVLENARLQKPETALLVMKRSVVYQRALRGVTNVGEIILPKLKSGYSECYRLLVISHLKRRQYRQAIAFSKEAIDLGLNNPEIFLYYAAVASYELNDYRSSIALLQEAISRDPDYAEAFYYLSLNLKETGQEDIAEQALARSVLLQRQGKEKKPKEIQAYLRVI